MVPAAEAAEEAAVLERGPALALSLGSGRDLGQVLALAPGLASESDPDRRSQGHWPQKRQTHLRSQLWRVRWLLPSEALYEWSFFP